MVTALGSHSPKLGEVRDLRTKRGRRQAGRFAFEGPTLLGEALDSGVAIDSLFATEAAYDALGPARARLNCPVYLVGERALARISNLETPPGLLAVAPATLYEPARLLEDGAPALYLAGIADPGNAGTLIRSAEIFGVRTVLFAEDAVEPYNPKVVRAAMGAVFRQRLATADGPGLAAATKEFGYSVVAADRSGTPVSEFTFPGRVVIAVGHERRGVGSALEGWDAAVAIQQAGGESLNAAVAGSIILYELSLRLGALSSGLSTRQKP